MRSEVTKLGRFDHRWMEHATLTDMSWLQDRRGKVFNLNGADFTREKNYLSDIMAWALCKSGIVQFSARLDIATQSMAKRRHFGSFCLALLYNFLAPVLRAINPGCLLAYLTKVYRYHDWTLNSKGTLLTHFDTGMECEVTPVSLMSSCDIAVSRERGTPVHFGAHPALTHAVHI